MNRTGQTTNEWLCTTRRVIDLSREVSQSTGLLAQAFLHAAHHGTDVPPTVLPRISNPPANAFSSTVVLSEDQRDIALMWSRCRTAVDQLEKLTAPGKATEAISIFQKVAPECERMITTSAARRTDPALAAQPLSFGTPDLLTAGLVLLDVHNTLGDFAEQLEPQYTRTAAEQTRSRRSSAIGLAAIVVLASFLTFVFWKASAISDQRLADAQSLVKK